MNNTEPTPEQVDEWANTFYVECCLLGAEASVARRWADLYADYAMEFGKKAADVYAGTARRYLSATRQ